MITKNKKKFIEFKDLDTNDTFAVRVSQARKHIALGYAVSVHKAQGSEYNEVCYVLTDDQLNHYNQNDNKLHYTAISRARHKVHIIK
jgi:ATP-dependent exoDNAse (exonuclease V) alpha subunit